MPYYNRDPKRDPNFDNHPYACLNSYLLGFPLYKLRVTPNSLSKQQPLQPGAMRPHTHTRAHNLFLYLYIYIHIHTHTGAVYMHTCMHAYIQIYIASHSCMQTLWPRKLSHLVSTGSSIHIFIHYITLHYYIASHYIALHCIPLHCIAVHCSTLRYIALPCLSFITLHNISLRCITSQYIAVHCITLHYIALQCITLHYIHTYIHTINPKLPRAPRGPRPSVSFSRMPQFPVAKTADVVRSRGIPHEPSGQLAENPCSS